MNKDFNKRDKLGEGSIDCASSSCLNYHQTFFVVSILIFIFWFHDVDDSHKKIKKFFSTLCKKYTSKLTSIKNNSLLYRHITTLSNSFIRESYKLYLRLNSPRRRLLLWWWWWWDGKEVRRETKIFIYFDNCW
jgi:hypothetical protein